LAIIRFTDLTKEDGDQGGQTGSNPVLSR